MPRKDRSFTGEDLRRIYCKNLTPTQRRFFDITTCDWDDYSPLEKVTQLLEALFDTGLMDEIGYLLPQGDRIKQFTALALFLLKGGDLREIDYVPVSFLDSLSGIFDQTIEAIEALGGSRAYQELILDLLEYVE